MDPETIHPATMDFTIINSATNNSKTINLSKIEYATTENRQCTSYNGLQKNSFLNNFTRKN